MKRWTKWTSEMNDFLINNYGWIGDTHLVELFEKKFPKHFPWTKKQIEKRRFYLGLKRSKEQENFLRCLNNKDGRQKKMWDTRGRGKEGEIRIWKGRKYIKVNSRFVLYYRHITSASKGLVVRVHEGKVEIITKKENQARNAALRAAQPPEVKETIKVLNKLKKLCQKK